MAAVCYYHCYSTLLLYILLECGLTDLPYIPYLPCLPDIQVERQLRFSIAQDRKKNIQLQSEVSRIRLYCRYIVHRGEQYQCDTFCRIVGIALNSWAVIELR